MARSDPSRPAAPEAPAAPRDAHWHAAAPPELERRLNTDLRTGLTAQAAAEAAREHGPNTMPQPPRRGPLRMLLDQFSDVMIIVLLVAAAVSGAIGELVDTVAILVIVLLNAVLGFVQEFRAARAIEALKAMSAPHAVVRRDGMAQRIEASELVPGDVVQIEAGDVVPADLRLVHAARLTTQEAALTGESEAVPKHTDVLGAGRLPVAERANMAFTGTTVAAGRGTGVVVATGSATELGGIARLLGSADTTQTPLQRRLARLGRRLAAIVIAISVIVFVAGLLRGEEPMLMLLTALSLAVAAIPEALPAVVAISLALGAYRMVARHALIRRLPAVETLGSITTICTDKTGTLTENRMHAEQVVPVDPAGHRDLLECLVLCNDASVRPTEDGGREVLGDPTEVALLEAAVEAGIGVEALRESEPRVAEIPFDAARASMVTAHRAHASSGGGGRVCMKGAPEAVLAVASAQWAPDGPVELGPAAREACSARATALAGEGMRVLAVATRRMPEATPTAGDLERDLVLLGLVALVDPPRAEAAPAVASCRAAGITPVMITGDHPRTALAIATRVGICDPDPVEGGSGPGEGALDGQIATGAELARMDDAELAARVDRLRVCARVDPAQKIRVVEALQARGRVVAMTGDGVNDAPALERADIGVAMGRGGTDVARGASDMVLLDDNFATIVAAVREGRRIYDNIRKFVKYTMTSNSGEIWLIFTAPFLGLPLPLLPIHILWVNLVTDGLPGIMLAREPSERGVMDRPPRPPTESVFAGGVGAHILWVGLLMGGLCLGLQAGAQAVGAPWQSMVFTTLTLSQLGHVMAIRSERDSLLRLGLRSNSWLTLTVVATVGLQLATLYVPALNGIFSTEPLSAPELATCVATALVVFVAVEAEKGLRRRASR